MTSATPTGITNIQAGNTTPGRIARPNPYLIPIENAAPMRIQAAASQRARPRTNGSLLAVRARFSVSNRLVAYIVAKTSQIPATTRNGFQQDSVPSTAAAQKIAAACLTGNLP